MKKLLALVLCSIFLLTITNVSFAETGVVEKPEVKIIINGKTGTYADVPIMVNDRTLLPLRAILINLGVQNDAEHIAWNGSESSVTVTKDNTKIYLKVNSKKATVNGVETDLDAAPVLYKDKTYIPARFVAQSFGKKVFWDATTSSVLIRDESEFNEVKGILTKALTATNEAKKVKVKQLKTAGLNINGSKITVYTDAAIEMDRVKKLEYVKEIQSTDVGTEKDTLEYFLKNNSIYNKTNTTQKWEKQTLTEKDFNDSFTFENIVLDELCASLVIDSKAKPDEILLKGEVSLPTYFAGIIKLMGVTEYNVGKANLEISINKSTNLINSTHSEVTGEIVKLNNQPRKEGVSATFNVIYNENSTDYNGSFEIVEPTGLPQ